MHWIMWVFWISVATLILGSYIFDFLTGRKYSLKRQEKTLNQNLSEADALREVGRYNHQNISF